MRISSRLDAVEPSATLALDSRASAMAAEGVDVISLAAGQPDFAPPRAAVTAARAALDAGCDRYTPVAGTLELREAITETIARERGIEFSPRQVVVSAGAKQALFNAFYVTCDPDDEILIPVPYWTSYPEMARALGIQPAFLLTGDDGRLSADALDGAVGPRTRAIVINSPCNPSGRVLDRAELEAVAATAREHDLWIISDDIYDRLVYPGTERAGVLDIAPDLADRVIHVNGMSKTYCMTGWRIGWAAAPEQIAEAMTCLQGHSTSCATAIAQAAAAGALRGADAEHVSHMVGEYARRGDRTQEALNRIDGVECAPPVASFYAYPRVDGLFGRRVGDRTLTCGRDVSELLLETAGVVVVPGEAFGDPRHVRLSFATAPEKLDAALERIAETLNSAR